MCSDCVERGCAAPHWTPPRRLRAACRSSSEVTAPTPEWMRPEFRTAPNTVAPKVLPRLRANMIGGGDAAALRPVDDLLDEDDRGAAREPHAEADERRPQRRRRRATLRASERRRRARQAGPGARRRAGSCARRKRFQRRARERRADRPAEHHAESEKPAISGDLPITPWTKTGRKVVSPMIAMPAKSEEALTAAIGRAPRARARSSARASAAPGQ